MGSENVGKETIDAKNILKDQADKEARFLLKEIFPDDVVIDEKEYSAMAEKVSRRLLDIFGGHAGFEGVTYESVLPIARKAVDGMLEEVREEVGTWDDELVQPTAPQMPAEVPPEVPTESRSPSFLKKVGADAELYCTYNSKDAVFKVRKGTCERLGCGIYAANVAGGAEGGKKKLRPEEFPEGCEYCTRDRGKAVKAMMDNRKSAFKMFDEGFESGNASRY